MAVMITAVCCADCNDYCCLLFWLQICPNQDSQCVWCITPHLGLVFKGSQIQYITREVPEYRRVSQEIETRQISPNTSSLGHVEWWGHGWRQCTDLPLPRSQICAAQTCGGNSSLALDLTVSDVTVGLFVCTQAGPYTGISPCWRPCSCFSCMFWNQCFTFTFTFEP